MIHPAGLIHKKIENVLAGVSAVGGPKSREKDCKLLRHIMQKKNSHLEVSPDSHPSPDTKSCPAENERGVPDISQQK
jgi:hypothetical protein